MSRRGFVLAKSRARHEADPEYFRAKARFRNKEQSRLHPDEERLRIRVKSAIRRLAAGEFTKSDVISQYDRQRGRCYYCNVSVGKQYHVDHVVPIAKGGTNDPANLVIACPQCNLRKGAKHPMEYAGRLC